MCHSPHSGLGRPTGSLKWILDSQFRHAKWRWQGHRYQHHHCPQSGVCLCECVHVCVHVCELLVEISTFLGLKKDAYLVQCVHIYMWFWSWAWCWKWLWRRDWYALYSFLQDGPKVLLRTCLPFDTTLACLWNHQHYISLSKGTISGCGDGWRYFHQAKLCLTPTGSLFHFTHVV